MQRRGDLERRLGERRSELGQRAQAGAVEGERRSAIRRMFQRRADMRRGAVDRRLMSGQGMVEYALVLVLISIVVIVILLTMGQQIANVFSNVAAALGA